MQQELILLRIRGSSLWHPSYHWEGHTWCQISEYNKPTCIATVGKVIHLTNNATAKMTLHTWYSSARGWGTRELYLMQPDFAHGNFIEVEKEECGDLFRISGHHTAWPEQPLTNTWNLQINGHFAICLPYPEHELHRFSREIIEIFSIIPLASPSSSWGSDHLEQVSTPMISEPSVPQAQELLWDLLTRCCSWWPQAAFWMSCSSRWS